MANLEDAIALAVAKHAGQKDKIGAPYILHPLRVMCRMKTEQQMMAAVLHDVVEDTEVTLDDLRAMGFPSAVVAAVDCLSNRPGESYDGMLARIKTNRLAIQVKMGDLEDNMDVRRLEHISPQDVERMEKYKRAWAELANLV